MHSAVDEYDLETEFHPLVDPDAQEWERNYAQWTHLAGLIGGIVAIFSAGVSFVVALLAVLILWQVKRGESPFVDDHGKEAVNFQLSILIYALLLIPFTLMTCGLGLFAAVPLAILAVLGTVRGANAAARGEYYRYPACIRLIR